MERLVAPPITAEEALHSGADRNRSLHSFGRLLPESGRVTNLFSNIFATVVIARWMGELDDARFQLVLDSDPDADIEAMKEPVLARQVQG